MGGVLSMNTHDESIETLKHLADYGLAAGAVTSPFWLQMLERGFGLFMLVGGALLLTLRIAIALREWREKKK